MKFRIEKEIFDNFPDLNVGLVVVNNINNSGKSKEILDLVQNAEKGIRKSFQKDKLAENSRIDVWRKAYSSFGAKPKKYRCSVENLYRMILDGIDLRHINKIVDLYNLVSVKNLVPIGGDDLDNVGGDIILKFARGDEKFVELNSEEIKSPRQGEVVYCDDIEVLCRRWNWRECDKSKMTESTKNATLVVEGLGIPREELEGIILDLKELILKYCGGESKSFILDKENTEVELI